MYFIWEVNAPTVYTQPVWRGLGLALSGLPIERFGIGCLFNEQTDQKTQVNNETHVWYECSAVMPEVFKTAPWGPYNKH